VNKNDNSERRDRLLNDPTLSVLVRRIFGIIPSYYDEREALEVAALIQEYVEGKVRDSTSPVLPRTPE
jgi:hypothetical protein